MSKPMNVGIYLFENLTMLDAYAPLQMFSFVDQFNTFTFADEKQPVLADCGAILTPDYDLASCPDIDILMVPGGRDVLPQMKNQTLMSFLKNREETTKYFTSVCTGSLILAEAGLLDGYKATTHWGWIDALESYDDIDVVDERVCVDRNRVTGGGITAGLDFALTLIAEVVDPPVAQATQLVFEYRPAPPYDAGSPDKAPQPVLELIQGKISEIRKGLNEYRNIN